MASELRKRILEASDIESEIVEIPEWGVKVEVRGLTAAERAKLLQRAADPTGQLRLDRWFADLTIASTFDPETGERVFDPADRDALNTKSGSAISRIVDAATRLSGLSEESVEEAKKGFGQAQNDDSPSS